MSNCRRGRGPGLWTERKPSKNTRDQYHGEGDHNTGGDDFNVRQRSFLRSSRWAPTRILANSRSLPISASPITSPERAGDGHFGNGKREFAIANPDSRGAARIIAGNDIDTAADQFGHVKPVLHARRISG